MPPFNLQPTLADDVVRLRPLVPDDFEALCVVASDPLIWVQHPNPDRYQRPVFQTFFDGAIASGGAFAVFDSRTHQLIGSTRFYNLDTAARSVFVGYTFLARSHWGGTHNPAMKRLLLAHAFRFVDSVHFHIGTGNRRSRVAIERLGARFVKEIEVAYHGEPPKHNAEYKIEREAFRSKQQRKCSEG
jgi:RimJ/RimL family protein N-acetyltransferase